MKSLLALLISLLTVYLGVFRFGNNLKKNKKIYYWIATVLSILGFLGMFYYTYKKIQIGNMYHGTPAAWTSPEYMALRAIFDSYFMLPYTMVTGGYLGVSIWSFVMWASYVKNPEWKSKMMSVRTELSIIGAIISMAQAVFYTGYILTNIQNMFVGGIMGIIHIPVFLILFYNVYLLIALGYTSFDRPKKKMGMEKWQKFQKKAYHFYAITFLEVILLSGMGISKLFTPDKITYGIAALGRFLIYTVIYCTYLIRKRKVKKATKLSSSSSAALL